MADNDANMSEPDLDFDEPLGSAQGVVAFSNIDDYYFSGEKAHTYGVYTGFKYQCVEYARRYMMLRSKCVFRQCGPAAELYGHTVVDHIETGAEHPWVKCDNGSTTVQPQVGMTVIYPQTKKMPVGHVAVISFVDVAAGVVGIAEQNQESKFWKGKPYGRLVPLTRDEEKGSWAIRETDPCLDDMSGWMYVEGIDFEAPLEGMDDEEILSTVNDSTLHMKVYREPKVLDKFIAPQSHEKKIIRFSSAPRIPNLPTFDGAACMDAKETRKSLASQYRDVVHANFSRVLEETKGKPSHVHHHRGEGPHFRRSGVARSAEWHSEYVPNEAVAIGGIGEANRSFLLVEECIAQELAAVASGSDADRAAFAARFHMPVKAVSAAAAQLAAASATRASKKLSAADCLIGTMGVFYDPAVDSNRVLHAELDSLNMLIDVNANQMAFGADVGRPDNWRMGGFGNDFNRAFRNLQKLRLHRREADLSLVFLDFGDVETLKAKHGFEFATADEAYQYSIERLNALYLAATLRDFLKEKANDLANGDLVEKDAPKWSLCVVEDALSRLGRTTAEDGSAALTVDGAAVPVAFKAAPWWALFAMAEKSVAGATAVVDVASSRTDFGVVLQPLWTHIASHPAFLPMLAAWAARHDDHANDAADPASNRVIPIASFPEADPSTGAVAVVPTRCTLAVPAFKGTVDPKYDSGSEPREPPAQPTSALKEKPATVFAPALQVIIAGGKRSCGCAVEGRHLGDDAAHGEAGTDVHDAVHPAPMTIIRDLHWW